MATTSFRRALIAVYDKTGIADFARSLVEEFGIEIISTGGTAKHLKHAGIPVTMVEEVTGFPELLDGRVKTLHPKIHAGILADRDNPEHMRQLAEHGIKPIDMVVVNLYPFEETIAREGCTFAEAIEMIDIGGPCMLRAAAKNHKHVLVVLSQRQYSDVLQCMRHAEKDLHAERLWGAIKTFGATSSYDRSIRKYLPAAGIHATDRVIVGGTTRALSRDERDAREHPMIPPAFSSVADSLRYGENPHQQAQRFFQMAESGGVDLTSNSDDSQLALSFNNYVDADAALGICAEISRALSSISESKNVWNRLIAGSDTDTATHSTQLPPVEKEQFSRRKLPHLERPGATYFVTFRLLDGELSPEERDIVVECCLHPDRRKVCLHAVCIMPDHVHIIMTPLESTSGGTYSLGDILHGIKGVSARRISELRGGSGAIWQSERFDRIIRNEDEYLEKLKYVCENPITAGLADADRYPWSICESEPGWSRDEDAAGVDLDHQLVCYFRSAMVAVRDWSRLLAGPTSPDRLLAGPTHSDRPLAGSTPLTRASAVCVFIKHTNACGVGVSNDPVEAYRRAYLGDPNAAMGGILAVDFNVDAAFASVIMGTLQRFKDDAIQGGCANPPQAFFAEVIVAPSFDEDAMQVIRTAKKWGERVRLLAVGEMAQAPDPNSLDFKRIAGGMLLQTPDLLGLNESDWNVATKRSPTDVQMVDLRLAWLTCKHTKSNAITICKDNMLIGNGAGQMSRVMSCRIATWLAKENGHGDKLAGAVAASDAFFPFRDGLDTLIDAGVTAIIQPGGSKRDEEVIAAADERGIAMIMTGIRHFKH